MIVGIDIVYGNSNPVMSAHIGKADGAREYFSFVGSISNPYPRLDVLPGIAFFPSFPTAPGNTQILAGGAAMLMLGISQAKPFHVFDARAVARRFRHAAIFGALDVLQPGECMRFVNDHDPLPLLEQLRQRFGGYIDIHYRRREPDWIVIDISRVD